MQFTLTTFHYHHCQLSVCHNGQWAMIPDLGNAHCSALALQDTRAPQHVLRILILPKDVPCPVCPVCVCFVRIGFSDICHTLRPEFVVFAILFRIRFCFGPCYYLFAFCHPQALNYMHKCWPQLELELEFWLGSYRNESEMCVLCNAEPSKDLTSTEAPSKR